MTEDAAAAVRTRLPDADVESSSAVLAAGVVALRAILAEDEGHATWRTLAGDRAWCHIVAALGIGVALLVGRALQDAHDGVLDRDRRIGGGFHLELARQV